MSKIFAWSLKLEKWPNHGILERPWTKPSLFPILGLIFENVTHYFIRILAFTDSRMPLYTNHSFFLAFSFDLYFWRFWRFQIVSISAVRSAAIFLQFKLHFCNRKKINSQWPFTQQNEWETLLQLLWPIRNWQSQPRKHYFFSNVLRVKR